jgi:hypothetical protein
MKSKSTIKKNHLSKVLLMIHDAYNEGSMHLHDSINRVNYKRLNVCF